MSLYFWIILLSFIGPFALSFDKKVAFYKMFLKVFLSILPVAIGFIIWDIYFTRLGVWGFNPDYLSGLYIYNLPIEECLFFIVVPFCCIFIHQVLKAYFPRFKGKILGLIFLGFMLLIGLSLALTKLTNLYTFYACLLSSLFIIYFYVKARKTWFNSYAFTYAVVLIPFLIVNGILTGAQTPEPIVWYSEEHIFGIRIITIPLEDLFYNNSMLLPIIGIFEKLIKK